MQTWRAGAIKTSTASPLSLHLLPSTTSRCVVGQPVAHARIVCRGPGAQEGRANEEEPGAMRVPAGQASSQAGPHFTPRAGTHEEMKY